MSYKLITKDGSAKRGEFTTPRDPDTGLYECRYSRRHQGCGIDGGSADDRNAGGIVKHLSFACETRRRGCKETRRFA